MPSAARISRQSSRRTKLPPPVPLPPPRTSEGASLDAPLERILFLHSRLKEGKRTTATTLMKQFEISRSTVTRDIEYMRNRLGMPIAWFPDQGTYLLTGPCDHLPFVVLETRDALALALAGRVCDTFHGTAFGRRLDGILKRLAPMLGGAVSVAVDSLEHVHTPESAGTLDELELVLLILEAITARQSLYFDYEKIEATAPEPRCVHPLHLVRLNERWRLIARDANGSQFRHFRLSRMRDVRAGGPTFVWPETFDVREHLRGTLGAFVGGEEHDVRIALDERAAFYAREQPWHPSQRLRNLSDGRVELTIRVNDLPGAKNLILHWTEHVEVLAPAPLRDEVREAHRAALARYDESD